VGTLRIGGEGKELFFKIMALGHTIYYDPSICVHHVVEVKKLTSEYMYRVASGIGRGEKTRTKAISSKAYTLKIIEYLFNVHIIKINTLKIPKNKNKLLKYNKNSKKALITIKSINILNLFPEM